MNKNAGWPKAVLELKELGYKATGRAKCRGCGREISWVITPNDRKMPLTPLPDGTFQPHHADCENVDQFRKAKS